MHPQSPTLTIGGQVLKESDDLGRSIKEKESDDLDLD